MKYALVLADLRMHLLKTIPVSTAGITREIKDFFVQRYSSDHNVLCSHAAASEYMTDVLIAKFNPKDLIQKGDFSITPLEISVLLAVESELGGTGASSSYGVMKNVVEDYIKLMIVRAQYRIMIFTSLPYAHETDHVRNRVEVLRCLYERTPGLESGVLLVHIAGTQPRSNQVQAVVGQESIRGFEISADGRTAIEISLVESPVAA